MQAFQIELGKQYAARDPVAQGEPLQRVEVLEKVRGANWKVRFFDDPNPGLIDYLKSKNLVCLWSERTKFLQDERRFEQLDAVSAQQTTGSLDDPVERAIDLVFESTGERGLCIYRGRLTSDLDAIERVMVRAGLASTPLAVDPFAFVDRFGQVHMTFGAAQRLAETFAAAEPKTVLLAIQAKEDKWEAEGWLPGERHVHGVLQEYRPAFALARQWSGFETQLQGLEAELKRLQEIVMRAITELRRAGAERAASSIERQLQGR